MNHLEIDLIYPLTLKYNIGKNDDNVSIIEITSFTEMGEMEINVYGTDGNLMVEKLSLPPFYDVEDDEDGLYTDIRWFVPFLKILKNEYYIN
jgi:hypothetical protein